MRKLTLVGVILVVGLVGCTSVPFGQPAIQEQPVPIKMVNNASQPETYNVSVVKGGSTIITHWEGGETGKIIVHEGGKTVDPAEGYKLARIDLPDSATDHGEYTLEPGESKIIELEQFPRDSAIVIVMYDEESNTIRAVDTLNCGGQTVIGLQVTVLPDGNGTRSTHQCG